MVFVGSYDGNTGLIEMGTMAGKSVGNMSERRGGVERERESASFLA